MRNYFRRAPRLSSVLFFALSFFLPFCLLTAVFAGFGFYPFGARSLLTVDMGGQYIHYYESLKYLVSGESGLFFSWLKCFGTASAGLFAYYMASPLSFLTLIITPDNMQLSIFFLTLIKLSLCGTTLYIYLSYLYKSDGLLTLLFSTSYALCSYNILYSSNLIWLDGAILLPVIMTGAEMMRRKHVPYLYIFSLALMFISSFYIAYQISIFCALFFIMKYFADEKVTLRGFFSMIGQYAGYAIIALGLSLWLLLPALYDLGSGGFAQKGLLPDKLTTMSLQDILLIFSPTSYLSLTNLSSPAIYSGILISVSFVLYFLLNHITFKKKIAALLLTVFFIISFIFVKMEVFWHAFRYPAWFPYRYAFTFVFFAIYIAYSALASPGNFLRLDKKPLFKRSLVLFLLLILVCVDLSLNANSLFNVVDFSFKYHDYDAYANFKSENQPVVDYIKATDNQSFYRIEKTYAYSHNDALNLGYRGISHYSSVFNESIASFTKSLGFSKSWIWNSYIGSTPLTDSLFSVKYILSKHPMPEIYPELIHSGDITVYENPYALPIGFLTPPSLSNINLSGYNYLENQNAFLKALTGTDISCFQPVENVLIHEQGAMVYTITTSNSFPLYVSFASSKNPGGSLYLNGRELTPYFTDNDKRVFFIGQFEPGTELTLSSDADKESLGLIAENFYYLDTEKLTAALSLLAENGLQVTALSNSRLEATINAAYDGKVFCSIPYDSGFTLFVDGSEQALESFNGTFMTFDITGGEHEIVLKYMPRGLAEGLTICIISIIALLLIALLQLSKSLRNKKS